MSKGKSKEVSLILSFLFLHCKVLDLALPLFRVISIECISVVEIIVKGADLLYCTVKQLQPIIL